MGLRDILDRITGKSSRSPYGRVRRRSEATTELAAAGLEAQVEDTFPHQAQVPPRAADRALPSDTTAGIDDGVHVPLQQVPGSQPPRRPAGAPPPHAAPAPCDAATQYLQVPIIEKSEVTAVLVVIGGDMKGEVFKLHTGENRLGRSESNDTVIASKWISRQHAMVIHRDKVFALVALSERNRTYLNDREVKSCEMSDGDLVRMGRTTLRFRTIEGL